MAVPEALRDANRSDGMKLLVFGASGRTGRLLIDHALARGVAVAGFVRRRERLTPRPGLEVIEGDVGDAAAVGAAVMNREAVISALGVARPLRADPVVRIGIEHVIAAMEAAHVRRLVYLSFIGVSAGRAAAGPLIRYVARFPLRHEIADHEIKERRIQASPLDWTIVRAPKLTDGPPAGTWRAGVAIRAASVFPRMSRADVAAFLLGEALTPQFPRRAVNLLPAAR